MTYADSSIAGKASERTAQLSEGNLWDAPSVGGRNGGDFTRTPFHPPRVDPIPAAL